MKKLLFVLALITTIFCVSCASIDFVAAPSFKTTINEENAFLDFVDISVNPHWHTANILDTDNGFTGFSVIIKNKTDHIVQIDWAHSSITYEGQSYTPFISGQKVEDATTPMADTVIPVRTSIVKDICASCQPYVDSKGIVQMSALDSDKATIVLCIKTSVFKNYYTIDVERNIDHD